MSSKTKYNTLSAAATVATSRGLNTLITRIITPAEKKKKKKDLTREVLRDGRANKKRNYFLLA